jgi:hypothetical protein
VTGCDECGAKTTRLQSALTGFRESALAWAASQQPAIVPAAAPRWWQLRPQWLLVAATLVLMTAVPAYRTYSAHLNAAREQALLDVAEDSALLRQVDTEISRAVPQPMEPLVTLVAWNTDANESHKGNNENNR